ncbi:MAG: DUF2167 domain-containing protein [Alphaproteobacteria bacterium]|nr:DUF2167 domain-containing protein [Alphaproteobacteria bacterium]
MKANITAASDVFAKRSRGPVGCQRRAIRHGMMQRILRWPDSLLALNMRLAGRLEKSKNAARERAKVGADMSRSNLALCVSVGIALAFLAGNTPATAQSKADLLKSLHFQRGAVALGDDLASLRLTEKFVYLDGNDAKMFLTRIWENPPSAASGTLGLLLPTDVSPLSDEGWAVVITYNKSGYVSDTDAEKIDYASLLKEMQEATRLASAERVKQGYEQYELVGWARQPYYDKKEKKLYWAKALRFGAATDETLNYEIRILGRKGVLSLNAVADMSAMARIDRSAPELLSMVSFNQGNLYSEFNPSIDEAAAYGVAGLIAGGLLTKAGFFKGLLVLLLASKKLVAVSLFAAFGGLWVGLKAMFGGRNKTTLS